MSLKENYPIISKASLGRVPPIPSLPAMLGKEKEAARLVEEGSLETETKMRPLYQRSLVECDRVLPHVIVIVVHL